MNIVHCVFEMETGGSQVLVVDLLNEMCKGHKVSLIIINKQFNESLLQQLNRKVVIYYINRKQGSFNPLPFVRLNLLLATLKPDIIHCHEYITSRYIRVKKGKLVNTIHNTGLSLKYAHQYHLLVAVSAAVCRDVQTRCTLAVTTIHNGINMDAFAKRKVYASEKNITWRLVQVSRLVHKYKGQDVALHALHTLVHAYGITNITLDFIGCGKSLPYLQNLVHVLQLGHYVRFSGDMARSWIFDHLCGYHVLIQPSRVEGFGLTIPEGIAAGLPVLASDLSGPAEILAGIPAGFLFNAGDSAACARQLLAIFDLYNNNSGEGLLKASATMVRNKYSLQPCATSYLAAYDQLLQKGE